MFPETLSSVVSADCDVDDESDVDVSTIYVYADVDECRKYDVKCRGQHYTCINTLGSYYCGCQFGYVEKDDICIGTLQTRSFYTRPYAY